MYDDLCLLRRQIGKLKTWSDINIMSIIMPNSNHCGLIKRDYLTFFQKRTDKGWYAATINCLAELAVKYENEVEDEDFPSPKILQRISRDDYIDSVIISENIIGLALVLCQNYINEVVTRILSFYKDYKVFCGDVYHEIDPEKKTLIQNYNPKIEGLEYTRVEVINALGNYYKHRDEWKAANAKSKNTIRILVAVGGNVDLNIYWAQNLRNCMKSIGIDHYRNLSALLKILDDWKIAIGESIEQLR